LACTFLPSPLTGCLRVATTLATWEHQHYG
jgi:hypothetical protein